MSGNLSIVGSEYGPIRLPMDCWHMTGEVSIPLSDLKLKDSYKKDFFISSSKLGGNVLKDHVFIN